VLIGFIFVMPGGVVGMARRVRGALARRRVARAAASRNAA
jgi:hypothetical protein